jgi:hypothetical protein
VKSVGGGGEINLTFKRKIENAEILEWEEMSWRMLNLPMKRIPKDGHYPRTGSALLHASLYMHCSFSGVVDIRMEELW